MRANRDHVRDCVGCRHLSLEHGWCNFGENTGELWTLTGVKRGAHGGCVLKDEEMERRVRARAKLDPKEDALRMRLYRQGMTDEEIARKVGTVRSGIAQWRIKRGLPINKTEVRQVSPERQKILAKRLELYKQGLCDEEIADQLGCHTTTIFRWRKSFGLEANLKKPT